MNNNYKVKKIRYTANAFTQCPIGKEWGNIYIVIKAKIKDTIPNYCDIDNFIQTEIDGHTFILEESAYKIYNFFKELCNPKKCKVVLYDKSNAFNTTYVTVGD